MAKLSASYAGILRGVSQQPPEQRLPGQHGEQVNMLSDPVAGVTRRPGTRFVGAGSPVADLSAADLATNFEVADIKVQEYEFTLHTRRPGSTGTTQPVLAVRRGHTFDNGLTVEPDGGAAPVALTSAARAALAGGVNAVAVVGDFLALAHTGVITTTTTEKWGTTTNRRLAMIQVRGGAYSRKFTARLKLVGQPVIVAEFTTPASAYSGVLDTSAIAASDPAYTKKVNDLVNAYNSAVTAWIGTAAAAIQPQAIAEQIGTALLANGGTAQGVTLGVDSGTVAITAPSDIEYLEVLDGGDGTLLKGTWQTISAAEDLPSYAFTGKVVQVSPREGDAYYMEATSDKGGFAKVVWKECAAASMTIDNLFCVGVYAGGGFIIGANPSDLANQLDIMGLDPDEVPVPEFGVRSAGDDDTNPAPHFVGRTITYLGVFQDRLLVAADNVVNGSLIGGYFSFFRTTVLTAPDDDPVEIFATGTAGDTIRRGVIFDKSLILCGNLGQYAVPGTVPLTPATASIMQSSQHIGAADVALLAQGSLVFYARASERYASIHQIAVGNVADTSNSSEISKQLSTYLPGKVRSMVAVGVPTALVVHTSGAPNSVFVFRYIDGQDGSRLLDSWSRWDFSPLCGTVAGLSQYDDRLRIHFVRQFLTPEGDPYATIAVDEVSLAADPATTPHLDSMVPAGAGRAGAHIAWGLDVAPGRRWQGSRNTDVAALVAEVGTEPGLVEGFPFDSYFTLTSPVRRDQNDAPITTGSLVVHAVTAVYRDTVGLTADVRTAWESYDVTRYIGRTVGAIDNVVGELVAGGGTEVLPVEQDTKEYELTIRSIDWYPLSVTSIDWTGQYFNRTRRA